MNKVFNVLGLMSGTSLDGVDVAWCKFEKVNTKWKFILMDGITYPYHLAWKKKLSELHISSAAEFSKTNFDLGRYFGDCVNSFIHRTKVEPDFISSHGHTVFHQPEHGFTSQIGSGAAIAATTGIDVVCDFRSTDVILGGQGAPLVPIGDALLFGDYDACLNLGGIANISYQKNNKLIAGDICYCNMALNYLAEKLNFDFDKDGKIARQGIINEHFLNLLNNDDFYKKDFPKSLGKEYFESKVKPVLDNSEISLHDKMRTFVQHIIDQINLVIHNHGLMNGTMLVTGGGGFNTFLINEMTKKLAIEVILPEKKIIDFKEALIFAFLGTLRWNNEINVLSSVTGSSKNQIAGCIYLGGANSI